MLNLKSCPFCGEKPFAQYSIDVVRNVIVLGIGCSYCGVEKTARMASIGDIDDLINGYETIAINWNRRIGQ